MNFIDDNHVQGEISDEEFAKKIEEEEKTRDFSRYGRDGSSLVFEEKYEYKGISYWVRILRYYQIGIDIKLIHGMNKIGKWAVLEYDMSVQDKVQAINALSDYGGSEFLFADTLHSYNEGQTLRQMVQEMEQRAIEDIDSVPQLLVNTEKKNAEKVALVRKLWGFTLTPGVRKENGSMGKSD